MATPILIGLSALALTSLSVTAPAHAQPVSKTVHYADLNLASDAGQTSLQGRIKAAARWVCDARQANTLQEQRSSRECMDAAMSAAMPKAQTAIAQYKSGARIAVRSLPVVGN